MHPALRLGFELPPITALGRADPPLAPATVQGLVAAARRSGHGAVWWADGPDAAGDPLTLVAGLSRAADGVAFGAMVSLAGGREPSVLARDVTALEAVVPGRALLLLRSSAPGVGPDRATADPAEPLQRLLEAAAVCRALFSGERRSFEGRFYQLHEAVNRPPPATPGPAIILDLSDVALPVAADDALSAALAGVDAVATEGPAQRVAALRSTVDNGGRGPAVVWRGSLADAGRSSLDPVAAALGAGADGVLWRWATEDVPGADRVAEVGAALGGLLR